MSAEKVLKIAQAEVGTKEHPANSNTVKYNTWYYGKKVSGSKYPWCMVFVQWVFDQAGSPLPVKTASCSGLRSHAQKAGKWVTKKYAPGDVVIFDFPNTSSETDHCGIVVSVSGSKAKTIEGNTSPSSTGSQSNGGGVFVKERALSTIIGAYRHFDTQQGSEKPQEKRKAVQVQLYQVESGSIGEHVRAAQILLNGLNDAKITTDGEYGPKTRAAIEAFQRKETLAADGIIGKATWEALLK